MAVLDTHREQKRRVIFVALAGTKKKEWARRNYEKNGDRIRKYMREHRASKLPIQSCTKCGVVFTDGVRAFIHRRTLGHKITKSF